jgi:anti-sigma-K factor RskA
MPRAESLAEQAARIDAQVRHQAHRRLTNRTTFNSGLMWAVVAVVWVAAAAIMAVGLGRMG